MAKPVKRKVEGGRVTPKGGTVAKRDPKAPAAAQGRYTPPIPREQKVSPVWVPVLMFTFLGLGLLLIFCNYLGLVPGFIPGLPDDTSNLYLLGGLVFILAGIITATNYH